jgi:L-rhamnose-H+ transport protein
MESSMVLGIALVSLAGLIMGSSPWPLKRMRVFQFAQFAPIAMFVALFLLPWVVTLLLCPEPFAALRDIPAAAVLKANLFSMSWGIAQILAMLCFARVGVSITYGILAAVGAALGVIAPMVVKASGVFQEAPDLLSPAGLTVLGGTAVMIVGVAFAARAGFGRERLQDKSVRPPGGFAAGLAMVVVAGILSVGWGFAFAYSQEPVKAAMLAHGASELGGGIAVWAVGLAGAGVVNILYPAFLLTRRRMWPALLRAPHDMGLSVLYGTLFFLPSIFLGQGMLFLGPLGASVGWGVTQGTLIIGGQLLGFASGEWRGVSGGPRKQIYTAIMTLIVAMAILAFGNALVA